MQGKRGYRVELDLTDKQITACRQHVGASRFAYNYGLHRKQECYRAGRKSPSAIDLHREINALKLAHPWPQSGGLCGTMYQNAPFRKACATWTTLSNTSFAKWRSKSRANGRANVAIRDTKAKSAA